MKEISSDLPHSEFICKIQKLISRGRLAGIINFVEKEDVFILEFIKFGSSKIFYKLKILDKGFTAHYQKESIAFTHHLFREEIEKYLVDLVRKIGAVVK
jgi:hypothetical protein